ncbi:FkbM family methyltransferase [Candidatus Njordibacter sp. Uisw_039]|uniref:FkbM family methyltransferase n=1 Tax=Candidatus Njordibacter sp. Uisw_039 TaxID=3230972 RepID=UPI003D569536
MENVGESYSRNKKFQEKFNREKIIQELVKASQPIIFDVGAHFGESVTFLKKVFPNSFIHSFEPDPDSFSVLTSSVTEKSQCFNIALSDIDGTACFYRNSISHTNSLHKVNTDSKDSISIAKAIESGDLSFFEGFNHEISVPTVRLDTFTDANNIDVIDLLKIDVQGAECSVLKGGANALKKTKVLILEISFFDYYDIQTNFMDVEQIIYPLGFRLFTISEISNNPMNGRTDWVEVIYINTNLKKSD